MKSELKIRTLQNLADASLGGELRVNREYQRGPKWSLSQKQGLIDSLLRGYQIPLFYVHLEARTNSYTGGVEQTAWLVDGQQRLDAIVAYRQNEFPLPNPQKVASGTILPGFSSELPLWAGKKFDELAPEDKQHLLGQELLVVEMTADHPNQVRDLFIRLQAGTPLTAQEKRDAWPGDFTNFVIRHAGKPGHPLSHPHRFFSLFRRSRGLTVDDGDHYVDGLADARKFFAGLSMTIMRRERANLDFVDLKGKVINEFYKENLDLNEQQDPAVQRVLRVLDGVTQLRGLETLREGRPLSFQWGFHLALLVDSLIAGNYSPVWRDDVVSACTAFRTEEANARLHYKQTKESLPHYERFGRLLAGSGSDTAEVIRLRHSFFLADVYSRMRIIPRDPDRGFDVLQKEVIWNRDRGLCQNPKCEHPGRRVPFHEATIHHVIEHTAGGNTTLQNGVLICPECHAKRGEMQCLISHFQAYLGRLYANTAQEVSGEVVPDSPNGDGDRLSVVNTVAEETGALAPGGRLKIVIDWGALDVERETQTIAEDQDSQTIVRLLVELIDAFGKPMKQQLTEFPIIRYPLSKDPNAFLNRVQGTPYSSIQVPGTDLYFCPQSHRTEKVDRLNTLFSRLTLPDGRGFPPDTIEISTDGGPTAL